MPGPREVYVSSVLIERGFQAGNEAHVKIVQGIPVEAKLVGASWNERSKCVVLEFDREVEEPTMQGRYGCLAPTGLTWAEEEALSAQGRRDLEQWKREKRCPVDGGDLSLPEHRSDAHLMGWLNLRWVREAMG